MSLVDSFASGTYKLKRQTGPGDYVEGEFIKGRVETSEIKGSLQVVSPRESLLLDEGDRDKESFKFYTDGQTFPGREKNLRVGDVITCYGRDFEVRSVERWQGTVDLPYFKAILIGVTKSEGSS
jgi:hypothetical protein